MRKIPFPILLAVVGLLFIGLDRVQRAQETPPVSHEPDLTPIVTALTSINESVAVLAAKVNPEVDNQELKDLVIDMQDQLGGLDEDLLNLYNDDRSLSYLSWNPATGTLILRCAAVDPDPSPTLSP